MPLVPVPLPLLATGAWSTGDWALRVAVPVALLVVGSLLLLRGRTALARSHRVTAGFGGPPGSSDVGTEDGFGEQDHRAAALSARRTVLWGGILAGVAVVWLLVTLVTALL
ncbi:MAG TPA: hypothetical protein VLO09_08250 [Ornithinimicrobium sp.]|nr:hypothetical protein [Ornithinimicrobium sp.]